MRHSIKQRTSVRTMSAIGALVILDPEAAAKQILSEFERSRGRTNRAAITLGCNERTLERLVFHLDLWPQVEACQARWRARKKNPLQLEGSA